NMVGEASNAMSQDPWLLVPTGAALIATVMAFGVVGDAVRDSAMSRGATAPPLFPKRPRHQVADEAPQHPGNGVVPVLSVQGLTVTIGGTTVVQNVSCDGPPGKAIGIVGESGCGKSITARAILGLLPAGGTVTAGQVVFDGTDLTALSDKELNRVRGPGIAFISQDPSSSLDPTFTIGSQLREVIRRDHPRARPEAQGEGQAPLPPPVAAGGPGGGPASPGARSVARPRRRPSPQAGRTVRRHGPARLHRHGPCRQTEAPHRRRADNGPGRDRTGGDPRTAA